MRRLSLLLPLLILPLDSPASSIELSWSTLRTLYRSGAEPVLRRPPYDRLEIRPIGSPLSIVLSDDPKGQSLLGKLPGQTPVLLEAGQPIRLGPVDLPVGRSILWLMGSELLVPPGADSRQSTPTDWSCLRICLASEDSGACIKRCGKDEG